MVATLEMKVVLNLSDHLRGVIDPETGSPFTVDKLARELGMNPRSISSLKKGTEKGEWITLVKIAEWLTEKTGRAVTVNDLLKVER